MLTAKEKFSKNFQKTFGDNVKVCTFAVPIHALDAEDRGVH